jgi:flagellar hook-associated protein 3 FlgL
MRITTQQQYLNAIDNMQQSQSRLSSLQNQVSTGKKLINPSDDPVAAAQVVKLDRELAQYEKFDDNINVTRRRLELEDSILDDINKATDRMRELTISAGNTGVQSDADRQAVAAELRQITDYVAGLMNTRDSEGEYLFGGSKGSTQPYQRQADGSYVYQGDDGQRLIQVGPDTLVASNDSGLQLFEAVDNGLVVQQTGPAIAAGNNFMANPSFENEAAESKYQEAMRGVGEVTLTVTETATAGQYDYRITDSGGNVLQSANGVEVDEGSGHMFEFAPGASLQEIVEAVNQVGAAPGDLMAILEALRQAGALKAELIVI